MGTAKGSTVMITKENKMAPPPPCLIALKISRSTNTMDNQTHPSWDPPGLLRTLYLLLSCLIAYLTAMEGSSYHEQEDFINSAPKYVINTNMFAFELVKFS